MDGYAHQGQQSLNRIDKSLVGTRLHEEAPSPSDEMIAGKGEKAKSSLQHTLLATMRFRAWMQVEKI